MSIWSDLLGAEVRYRGNRFRTRVIEAGDGPVLVLLHGGGGHAEAYSRNVVRLSRDFRVLAIDMLWHGLSAKPPYGDPFVNWTGQIADLLDSMGIEKAHIEGESLGGWVAMWMTRLHRQRVDKLILNTAAGVRYRTQSLRPSLEAGRADLAARSIAALENPTRESIAYRLRWLMHDPADVTEELIDVRLAMYSDPETKAALRSVFANQFGQGHGPEYELTEEQVGEIDVPTFVLWSEHNPGKGPDVGERLADLIPGAKYHCMKACAHWPQWEQPEQHDRLVRDFLLSD